MNIASWPFLSWLFREVNPLSTSEPPSAGLMYKATVGNLLDEREFVEAVGISTVLPGSDVLQLVIFVGHAAGGIPGATAALIGSILSPTVLMLAVITVLQCLRGEAWINNFVRGLAPAVAVLVFLVARQVFRSDGGGRLEVSPVIAAVSAVTLPSTIHPPLVLLAAGLVGVLLFR